MLSENAIKTRIDEAKGKLEIEEELMEALDRYLDANVGASYITMQKLKVATLYAHVVRSISARRRELTVLFQRLEEVR